MQSRVSALSVRGWEVAPKRKALEPAAWHRVRCHILKIGVRLHLTFEMWSICHKKWGDLFVASKKDGLWFFPRCSEHPRNPSV